MYAFINCPWVKPWELVSLIICINVNIITRIVNFTRLKCAIGNTSDSVYKRKLCHQFEMKDHTSTVAVIVRKYNFSKIQCMVSCTRHRSCNIFYFRSIDGICELLEISSEICMSHNVTIGSSLVRLAECNKTPPWRIIIPTQRKLQWMEPHNVAHVLHGGAYLPGFVTVKQGKFQAATMENGNIKCKVAFRVLTYAHPNDYQWINFTIGDDISPSAVVGGYWRDQTPLYVISAPSSTEVWKPGFYNAVTEKTRVKNAVDNYKPVALLLENNWKYKTVENQKFLIGMGGQNESGANVTKANNPRKFSID